MADYNTIFDSLKTLSLLTEYPSLRSTPQFSQLSRPPLTEQAGKTLSYNHVNCLLEIDFLHDESVILQLETSNTAN